MNAPRISLPRRGHEQSNGSSPTLRPREQPTPRSSPAEPAAAPRTAATASAGRVLLVLIALIGYWSVYSASTKRTPVLVTTHALAAGTVLSSGDLRTAELAGDSSVLASMVPERELSQTIGRRLSTALPPGMPLPSGALAVQQSQTSAMTLAVPEFDVSGASLQAGDAITVLATYGAGTGQATTRPIARDLQILSIGEAPSNSDPSTATVPVTLSVTDPSISVLARARQRGRQARPATRRLKRVHGANPAGDPTGAP